MACQTLSLALGSSPEDRDDGGREEEEERERGGGRGEGERGAERRGREVNQSAAEARKVPCQRVGLTLLSSVLEKQQSLQTLEF